LLVVVGVVCCCWLLPLLLLLLLLLVMLELVGVARHLVVANGAKGVARRRRRGRVGVHLLRLMP